MNAAAGKEEGEGENERQGSGENDGSETRRASGYC